MSCGAARGSPEALESTVAYRGQDRGAGAPKHLSAPWSESALSNETAWPGSPRARAWHREWPTPIGDSGAPPDSGLALGARPDIRHHALVIHGKLRRSATDRFEETLEAFAGGDVVHAGVHSAQYKHYQPLSITLCTNRDGFGYPPIANRTSIESRQAPAISSKSGITKSNPRT